MNDGPENLPRAWPVIPGTGSFREQPEDFQVDEELGFEPDGRPGHLWLRISKRCLNTSAVARDLARRAAVPGSAVGYSGMKDRYAVTSQWFSVPGQNAEVFQPGEPCALDEGEYRIIDARSAARKIKTGCHRSNRFRIRLRGVSAEKSPVDSRLALIDQRGFPNYFGPQRFGRNASNLRQAEKWFRGEKRVRDRHLRGLLLSAARAQIFNLVLAERVARQTWDRAEEGDALQLGQGGSFFLHDGSDSSVPDRIQRMEIHPTGALWGRGLPPTSGEVLALEQAVAAGLPDYGAALEQAGMKQARRGLRAVPDGLRWDWTSDADLDLRFGLSRGVFATSLLDEVLCINY